MTVFPHFFRRGIYMPVFENPLISVIVPVYKTESFLDACVASILSQTYTNLEVILVDDGSPDNCGKMCDAWAEKDSRIIVIHKENGGLSSARNAAFEVISGELVAFVDSDDYIDTDMLGFLLENMTQYDADISMCGLRKIINGIAKPPASLGETQVFSREDAYRHLLLDKSIVSHAWDKLYRKHLWETVRFPEGRIYEDIAIMHEVFWPAGKTVYSPVPKYNYLIHSDSISLSPNIKRSYYLALAFADRLTFTLQVSDNPEYKDIALMKFSEHLINACSSFFCLPREEKKKYESEIAEIKTLLHTWNKSLKGCPMVSNAKKQRIFFLRYFPSMYIWLQTLNRLKKNRKI